LLDDTETQNPKPKLRTIEVKPRVPNPSLIDFANNSNVRASPPHNGELHFYIEISEWLMLNVPTQYHHKDKTKVTSNSIKITYTFTSEEIICQPSSQQKNLDILK
jgi:hypothetical protein